MNLKKIILVIILILICGIITILTWQSFNKKETVNVKYLDNVSVRMKWYFSGTMSGWFAGKEQGIFKDNNINLTINSGGPDNNSIKLVAAGTDQFGVAGADEVLIARNKGIPVVAIGVLFKDSPIGFISKKSKNINTPKEWNNKTIEVDFGSNAEVQYRALLKKFDVKNVREIPYAYSLIPFIEDKTDVSVAYIMDQVVTLRKRGIDLNLITCKQYGINPYGDVIIANENTVKENPDLVKRFLKSVIMSHQWAIKNPDSSVISLIHTTDNLKFDNELDVWKATIPFLAPDNNLDSICIMEINRWKSTMNVLVEFNIIPNNFNLLEAISQNN